MAYISMMFNTEGYYKVAVSKDGKPQLLPNPSIRPSDRDRFQCSLRLLHSGKILVGSDPDDTDEGAAVFWTLRELIASGTKRIACFFRQAIFDAQSFCGEAIDMIVLVIPAAFTTAENLKLYAAASLINVSLRLMTASDALAYAFADECETYDDDGEYYGVLHMDMEFVETALYNYSCNVMELMEIHTEDSPMRKLEKYVEDTLTSAVVNAGADRESISPWAFRKITFQLFQLSEHDFPYSVDLSEVVSSVSGTYSFEWKSVMAGIGNLHIPDILLNRLLWQSPSALDPFLLIVNGYDYDFPLIEAAIKRQNEGGTTLFCREKPYALLAACNYAAMFLGKCENTKLILTAAPHDVSVATGCSSRITLAKSGTTLPTRISKRFSIDPNGTGTADIILYEHETPILYAPIPLPKGSAIYTLTFDQRSADSEAKQYYYTAQIVSEDGLKYDLLPCDAALIPSLSDNYGPIIRLVDDKDVESCNSVASSKRKDPDLGDTEGAAPSQDPQEDGDTISFEPLLSNQDRLRNSLDSADSLSAELKRLIDSGATDTEAIVKWLNQVDPQS